MAKLLGGTRIYGNATIDTFLSVASNIAAGNISADVIAANTWVGLTTTAVQEGNNLYYTNNRVYSNVVQALSGYATVANLNAKANVGDLTTANVLETSSGLYYTNVRVYSNVIGLISGKANVSDLTTSNVAEGTQLYYTNSRARTAVSSGTGVSYDNVTGVISIGQNVSTTATVTFANLNVTGIVNLYGNVVTHSSNNLSISDNMIYLNSGSESSNPDLGFAFNYNDGVYHHGGFFRDATDGTFKVFDNYTPEPDANIFIDTNHATFRLANIAATTFYGNVVGTINSLSNFSTSNLVEGINLYYTNARVLSNVQAYLAANPQGSSSTYSNSNVAAYLTTYTGNISAGNVIASTIYANSVIGTETGGYITGANLISTNVITALVWTGIYTANVLETSGNLYFTNARVYANVAPLLTAKANVSDLTTANVAETATGLYYTNARVYSNVISLLNAKANVTDLTTANVVESASGLYYTNSRVLSNVVAYLAANPQGGGSGSYSNSNVAAYLTTYTGNVSAGNVIANSFVATGSGAGSISSSADFNITATGNIALSASAVRSSNIYVDKITANIWSGLIAGNNIIIAANGQISANLLGITAGSASSVLANGVIGLNTANVNEFGSNLYYTNTRVLSNIQAYLAANPQGGTYANSNVAAYLPTYTGNISAGNVIANSFVATGAGSGSISSSADFNITATGNINLSAASVYTGNIVANRITANSWSQLYAANVIGLTTANVSELTNLYYTNARVASNVIALLPTLAGDNITIAANGRISSTASGGVSQASLTTANVIESASNLYYTNARVYSNVVSLLATYTGNVNAGNLSIQGGSGGTIGGANLISTNIISALTWTGIYTANVLETSGNLYFTNARVYSNVIGLLNAKANVTDLTTANVAETASGLYYTNARVRSALSAGTGVVYDNSTGVISIGQNVSTTANVTFASLNITGVTNFYGNVITHSSNNLSISDNMIYLNAGSESSNPDLGISGNYNDGVYHHAGFFRDASDNGTWKVFENYSPEPDANIFIDTAHATFRLANISATTFIGNVTGTVGSIANFSTSNLTEGNNLYYTNARVYSNVISLISVKANVSDLTTANVTETASGLYYTNARVYSNVVTLLAAKANVSDLTTANVVETASGLYYTNSRVRSNVIALLPTLAGDNITIEANGRISSTATGGGSSNVGATYLGTLTSTATYAGGNANITLGTSVTTASDILVLIDGLTQIPTTDYTVTGTALQFTSAPHANSTVEVRYVGSTAITHSVITKLIIHPFLLMGA